LIESGSKRLNYSLNNLLFLVGMDIPDYISTGGMADAIKSMSDKMKALGK